MSATQSQDFADKASSSKGLSVAEVPARTLIRVTTLNNTYELLVVDPATSGILVCSTHPRWPGPLFYNTAGDQFTAIPIVIKVGSRLRMHNLESDEGITTSNVHSIEIVEDEKRIGEILAARDNPTSGISEEEFDKQRMNSETEFLPEAERDWARDFLTEFLYCREGYFLILSVLLAAYEHNCLSQARESLKKAHDKHWYFQHPERRGLLLTPSDESHLAEVYAELGIEPPGKSKS
ncbi:MAG: hypothetical protein WC553_01035 [Patescibacteria group bacterium]|jgi:hypothetical protein